MRREKQIGSSLQAIAVISDFSAIGLELPEAEWADICITSGAKFDATPQGVVNKAILAPGQKCERCWRVLEEVGTNTTHPTLCRRCCEAIEQ